MPLDRVTFLNRHDRPICGVEVWEVRCAPTTIPGNFRRVEVGDSVSVYTRTNIDRGNLAVSYRLCRTDQWFLTETGSDGMVILGHASEYGDRERRCRGRRCPDADLR